MQWDDSLGMSPELTYSKGRFHLPSLKRNAFSPLKEYEDERFPKRRKNKRWSLQEEDMLRTCVQKYVLVSIFYALLSISPASCCSSHLPISIVLLGWG